MHQIRFGQTTPLRELTELPRPPGGNTSKRRDRGEEKGKQGKGAAGGIWRKWKGKKVKASPN